MRFVVTDDIFETFPDVRIGVVVARGITTLPGVRVDLSDVLVTAQETVRTALAGTNVRGNCLPLWVDQGDGGVVGSTKD